LQWHNASAHADMRQTIRPIQPWLAYADTVACSRTAKLRGQATAERISEQ
jgi:hypothetical protein